MTRVLFVLLIITNLLAFGQLRALDAKFKIEEVTQPINSASQWSSVNGHQVAPNSGNIYFIADISSTTGLKTFLGKIDNTSKKKLFIAPSCFETQNSFNWGLFVTKKEEIYVIDRIKQQIFGVDWDSNNCTLIAGSGGTGYSGDGGLATNATFRNPCCIHVENNIVYIADTYNNVVRAVKDGIIYTIANFHSPVQGLYVAPNSDFYFVASNLVYRRYHLTKVYKIIAGNYTLGRGFSGDGGPATNAQFNFEEATGFLVVDNQLFITDTGNKRVRVVDLDTGIVNSFAGTIWNTGPIYKAYGNGDGGPAVNARFIELNPYLSYYNGYIYTSDASLISIRRINMKTNIISSIFGQSYNSRIVGVYEDGTRAIDVNLQNPKGLALDSDDNLLVSDPNYGYLINITKDGLLNFKFPKQMKYFSDVYQPFLQKITSISTDGNSVSVVSENGYIQKLDSNLNSQMIGGPLTPSRFFLNRIEDIVLSSPKGLYSYNDTLFVSGM